MKLQIFLSLSVLFSMNCYAEKAAPCQDPQTCHQEDEDLQTYIEKLAARMKASKSIRVSLKEGWRLAEQPTTYSDQFTGWVVDPNGVPRIYYRGKSALYEQRLSISILSPEEILKAEDILYPERKDLEIAEKKRLESQCLKQLQGIMSGEVFDRFAYQLDSLLYGDACYRGYVRLLSYQVDVVEKWYSLKEPQEAMNKFLEGECKETSIAQKFNQFLEMFVHRNTRNLELAEDICQRMDAGVAQAMFGAVPNQNDLYSLWKEKKKKQRFDF